MNSVSIKDLMCTRFATIHPEMPVVEASSKLIIRSRHAKKKGR